MMKRICLGRDLLLLLLLFGTHDHPFLPPNSCSSFFALCSISSFFFFLSIFSRSLFFYRKRQKDRSFVPPFRFLTDSSLAVPTLALCSFLAKQAPIKTSEQPTQTTSPCTFGKQPDPPFHQRQPPNRNPNPSIYPVPIPTPTTPEQFTLSTLPSPLPPFGKCRVLPPPFLPVFHTPYSPLHTLHVFRAR